MSGFGSLSAWVELAEALGHAGQISDGLAVIDEALAWVESGERWAISEVLHIKGELVLLQGAGMRRA
jgi:hypothetical protein